jgi:hypothetical protein
MGYRLSVRRVVQFIVAATEIVAFADAHQRFSNHWQTLHVPPSRAQFFAVIANRPSSARILKFQSPISGVPDLDPETAHELDDKVVEEGEKALEDEAGRNRDAGVAEEIGDRLSVAPLVKSIRTITGETRIASRM